MGKILYFNRLITAIYPKRYATVLGEPAAPAKTVQ